MRETISTGYDNANNAIIAGNANNVSSFPARYIVGPAEAGSALTPLLVLILSRS
jgi:hypothetical protein